MLKKTFILLFLFLTACFPVYMINSDTNLEAGMLNVCWMRDGSADYNMDPLCDNPEEISYSRSRIPLIVYSSYEDSNLLEAIDWVNNELDCEIFRFDRASLHPDVRVYLNVALPTGGGFRGTSSHRRLAGGQVVAAISTYMLFDNSAIQYTLEHELLHVAGLAHDDFQYSVMYPLPRTTWVYHITTHDKRLLRERYCD